jgi:hypothetical protein
LKTWYCISVTNGDREKLKQKRVEQPSLPSYLIMAFETPWAPQLNGNAVQFCKQAQDLIHCEVFPNPGKNSDHPWS